MASVTELLTLMKCERQWAFRYREKLRAVAESDALRAGRVVHATIAEVLQGNVIRKEMAEAVGKAVAVEEEDEKKRAAMTPGILNALGQVPEWVWGEEWRVEERLSVTVGGEEVVGIPDLVSADGSRLVEVKTTEHDPLDYLLGNPQHRFYLYMLQTLHPDTMLDFVYLCLPLRGKAKSVGVSWPWSAAANKQAGEELKELVDRRNWTDLSAEYGLLPGTYSTVCSFCDYKTLCLQVVAGKPWENGLRSEEFTKA